MNQARQAWIPAIEILLVTANWNSAPFPANGKTVKAASLTPAGMPARSSQTFTANSSSQTFGGRSMTNAQTPLDAAL